MTILPFDANVIVPLGQSIFIKMVHVSVEFFLKPRVPCAPQLYLGIPCVSSGVHAFRPTDLVQFGFLGTGANHHWGSAGPRGRRGLVACASQSEPYVKLSREYRHTLILLRVPVKANPIGIWDLELSILASSASEKHIKKSAIHILYSFETPTAVEIDR